MPSRNVRVISRLSPAADRPNQGRYRLDESGNRCEMGCIGQSHKGLHSRPKRYFDPRHRPEVDAQVYPGAMSPRFYLATALTLFAGPAFADPCEARVSGYKPGATVAGVIRYVGDGDGLCIGPGDDPTTWTEIRLADFYAPELNEPGGRQAKAALDRFVGQRAVCTAERGSNGSTRSYDRLIARCTVNGRSLADSLRKAGSLEGGRGR